MGILIYLITLRLKRIFDFKSHPVRTIGVALFLVIAILYGFLFAQLSNSQEFQVKTLPQNEFAQYIVFSLAIITFLRGFFPTYVPLRNILPKSYPLRKTARLLHNLIYEFVYPFYLGIILFVLTFSVQMNGDRIKFFLIAFSWIVISHLLKRLIQFCIEFRFKEINIFFISLTIIVLVVPYFLFFNISSVYINYAITLLIIIVLLLMNFLFESTSKELKSIIVRNSKKKERITYHIKLLLNNNSLRTMVLVALFMKIFFVLLNMNLFTEQSELPAEVAFFLNFILSPIFLFTYLFNNFFGFSRSIWLSMNKVGVGLFSYYKQILKVLAIPIILDAIITISFLIFFDVLNYTNLLIYINNCFLLIVTCVINSFYFPKKVTSLFSIKSNTSIWASVLSMISVAVVILLLDFSPFVSITFSAVLALSIYDFFRDKILKNRYKIFRTIFG